MLGGKERHHPYSTALNNPYFCFRVVLSCVCVCVSLYIIGIKLYIHLVLYLPFLNTVWGSFPLYY